MQGRYIQDNEDIFFPTNLCGINLAENIYNYIYFKYI